MTLVERRRKWADQMAQVRRMRGWIIQTEHILAGEWISGEEKLSNELVASRFDQWCSELEQLRRSDQLSKVEQGCLTHFLKITAKLRPHLIQCYSLEGLPRTNNDMESYIRNLKTRYRRVSGRKNWNSYLLRYGRSVAYYGWLEENQSDGEAFSTMLKRVDHPSFRKMRKQDRQEGQPQLKKLQFNRNPSKYLASLEECWDQTLPGTKQLH